MTTKIGRRGVVCFCDVRLKGSLYRGFEAEQGSIQEKEIQSYREEMFDWL